MNQITSKQFSAEQIDVIKRTIAPGLTDDELRIFLYTCERTGLCPFSRQIYAIKRGGKLCLQTGIDGFRLIAERTGKYAPGKDTEYLYDDKGSLIGAKVFVKKMTPDGTWHEVSSTAFIQEYSTRQGMWSKIPHVMIAKVSESQALRRCFPADLSGLYAPEEMDQADIDVQTVVIPEDKAEVIEQYAEKHPGLKKALLGICGVDSISKIKPKQLDACRRYIKAWLSREEKA